MIDIRIKIIDGIKRFEEYAFLTDTLFVEKYGIRDRPLIAATNRTIPRNGELVYKGDCIKYRFHGNGCAFTFEDRFVVNFNYSSPSWEYEGFSLFKFWAFIKELIPELENKEELEVYLNELVEQGTLIKVKPPYSVYKFTEEE